MALHIIGSRACNSLAMNNRLFVTYFSGPLGSSPMQKMTLLAGILLLFTACGEYSALRYAWIIEEREEVCARTHLSGTLLIKMVYLDVINKIVLYTLISI